MVLPLVPVMPVRTRRSSGHGKNSATRVPAPAGRARPESMAGEISGPGNSLTTASAPRSRADAAYLRPSAREPGKAKKRKPGWMRRES